MMRAALLAAALIAGTVLGSRADAASAPQPASGSAVVPARPDAGLPGFAIVTQDNTALRAAPRDSAATQAVLWQGDALEVRGQRADYLQVYDHRRERAGYVRATQVRTTNLKAEDAPELLAVLRFVRELRGSEALGLAYSAAYLKAAPAGTATAEAFDAMGQMAERLARRASGQGARSLGTAPSARDAQLTGQLEGLAAYGVKMQSIEQGGRVQLCYDGEAFGRVLAQAASAEQRANAVLGLTRHDCQDPASTPALQHQHDQWRANLLEQAYRDSDYARLPEWLKNRVQLRRAGVWAVLAYQNSRLPDAAPQSGPQAAQHALSALAAVNLAELIDEDQAELRETAMRVGASRWAAVPQTPATSKAAGVQIVTRAGEPGQTCVLLVDARHDAGKPLHSRCTFGIVWSASARSSPNGKALSLAVQTQPSWREHWLYRQTSSGWVLDVMPPGTAAPELGYLEFAGWANGGQQLLLAREAQGDGRYRRSFEVLRLDTLVVDRQASSPSLLAAFRRSQDPAWKAMTVSLRQVSSPGRP